MIFRDYIKIDKLDIMETLSVIGNATFSRVKIVEGANNNYVLVSDTGGTASWQSPKTVVFNGGGVTGSGTINYIPKWVSTTQLSSTSSVFDDGSSVGIGTTTPTAKVHIKSNTSDVSNYSLKVDNSSNTSVLYIRNNGAIQQGNNTATGTQSFSIGYGTTASGNYSHSEGYNTTSSGYSSHAEGNGTIANATYSHAEGIATYTSYGNDQSIRGIGSHAEGESTHSGGWASHAEGYNTTSIGTYSHAEGITNQSVGIGSHTEGSNNISYGNYSHAEGEYTRASGDYSHAEGMGEFLYSYGDHSHAEGNNTRTGLFGFSASISNDYVYLNSVYGNKTTSFQKDQYIYFEGQTTPSRIISSTFSGGVTTIRINTTQTITSTIVNNISLVSVQTNLSGVDKLIKANRSHSEGYKTFTIGVESHSEGFETLAYGAQSHAEGLRTKTIGNSSHAEGRSTTSVGQYSHAEGMSTISVGQYSHTEGYYNTVVGDSSHTEGSFNILGTINSYIANSVTNGVVLLSTSYGDVASLFSLNEKLYIYDTVNHYSYTIESASLTQSNTRTQIILKDKNVSFGQVSVVNLSRNPSEWTGTYTIGSDYSHAEGASNLLFGRYSHTEGKDNILVGDGSHIEGESNTSIGNYSHTEGTNNKMIGEGSHIEGSSNRIGIDNGFLATDVTNGVVTLEQYYDDRTGDYNVGDYLYIYGEGIYIIADVGLTQSDTQTQIFLEDTFLNLGSVIVMNLDSNFFTLQGDQNINVIGAHTEGQSNHSIGNWSHAEGLFTKSIGLRSHAEGMATIALGNSSHSEGQETKAIGNYSHAEGTNTKAIGNYSHAEGENTTTIGESSHASGRNSVAISNYSFIHSDGSTASGTNSVVLGGSGINGTAANTVYVPNLNINFLPSTGSTLDNLLVRGTDGTVMIIPNTAPSLDKVLASGNITGTNNIRITTGYRIKGASASNNYISMGQNGTPNNILIGTETTDYISKLELTDSGIMKTRVGPSYSTEIDMNKYSGSAFLVKDTIGTQSIATIGNIQSIGTIVSIKVWFLANLNLLSNGSLTDCYSADINSLFSVYDSVNGTLLGKLESYINETTPIYNSKVNVRTDGTNIILDVYQNINYEIYWKVFYEYIVSNTMSNRT